MKILNFKITTAHTNELGDSFIAYKDAHDHLFTVCTKTDATDYINAHANGIVVFPDDAFAAMYTAHGFIEVVT